MISLTQPNFTYVDIGDERTLLKMRVQGFFFTMPIYSWLIGAIHA